MVNFLNKFMKRYFQIGRGLLFLALILMSGTVFGQNRADTLKTKHAENVTVYGTSKPVIQKAYKINQVPKLPKFELPSTTFQDNFVGQEMPTTIAMKPLKPSLINEQIRETSWNNIFRTGFGSRISPYAEFFHSSGKESSYRFNIHLYHYSSFENIKNYLPSPYSNTSAVADFEKYFTYHILGFKAAYELNTNRYYGHETTNDTVPFNKNDNQFKQRYQKGSFAIDYSSSYRDFDKLHHRIYASTYYISDIRGTSELFVGGSFDVHKSFQVYNLFNHQALGLQGKYSFYREKTNLGQSQDNYIDGLPYFNARFGMIAFKAGINVQWLESYNNAKLHVFPLLDVKFNAIPQRFSLFAGVTGGLKKNSLEMLSKENPFLSSYNNKYYWQNTRLEFYGGFKGNIARKLDFDVHASYRTFENMAFFDYPAINGQDSTLSDALNPLTYLNTFNVSYAGGNLVSVSAGFTFVNSSSVKIWLLGNYNHYQLDNGYLPIYKPLKEIRFGCSVRTSEKIRPWIEAYYMGIRWASRPMTLASGSTTIFYELPAYYNINFGGNYQINTQLSAFLRVINLLNQQYMQFNDYPVAGLEVMAGVSYRF